MQETCLFVQFILTDKYVFKYLSQIRIKKNCKYKGLSNIWTKRILFKISMRH